MDSDLGKEEYLPFYCNDEVCFDFNHPTKVLTSKQFVELEDESFFVELISYHRNYDECLKKISELASVIENCEEYNVELDFYAISNQIHELKTEVNSLNIMCLNMRSEMSELRRICYENNKLLALICYKNNDSETEQFVSFCYCS